MDLRSKRMLMNIQASSQEYSKLLDYTKQQTDAQCVLFASINPHNGIATIIGADSEYGYLEGDIIQCPMHVNLMMTMTSLSAPIPACDFSIPLALQNLTDEFIVIAAISNLQNDTVGVLFTFFKTPFLSAQQQCYVDIARQKIEIGLQYQLVKHPYSERLTAQLNLLEEVSKVSKVGAWEVDRLSGGLSATSVAREIIGLEHLTKMSLRRVLDFFDATLRDRLRRLLLEALRSKTSFECFFEFINAKGKRKSVKLSVHMHFSSERIQRGRVSRLYGAIQDDTEVQQLSESQHNFAEYITALLNNTEVAVLSIDASGTILSANDTVECILGFTPDEIVGLDTRTLLSHQSSLDTPSALSPLSDASQARTQNNTATEVLRHKSGRRVTCEVAAKFCIIDQQAITILTLQNVTEQLHEVAHYKRLAFRDEVTGLHNMHYLNHYLSTLSPSDEARRCFCACIRLCIKNISEYERALGLPSTDYIQRVFAQRLYRIFEKRNGQDYVVCKSDNGSFYLFLTTRFLDSSRAISALDNALQLLQEHVLLPVNMHNDLFSAQIQMASCTLPYHHLSLKSILNHLSDKHAVSYRLLSDTVIPVEYCYIDRHDVERYNYIKRSFTRALSQDELFIELQPQYNADNALTNSEVLVRWKHPQLGVLYPKEFISIAEENDCIADIDLWVCDKACEILSLLNESAPQFNTRLSINVSARHLARGDFIERFVATVDKWNIVRSLLSIELSESTLFHCIDIIQSRVTALAGLGFSIAIDGFGVTHTNLAMLQVLPVSEIKVDRQFVSALCSTSSQRDVVKRFCDLASAMQLNAVASGIENASQLHYANECGCSVFQGHYLDEPMSVATWKEKFYQASNP